MPEEDKDRPTIPLDSPEEIEEEDYEPRDPQEVGEEIAEMASAHYGEEEWEAAQRWLDAGGATGGGKKEKMLRKDDPDAIKYLDGAIQRSSWWDLKGQPLEKSPGIWRESDQVPEAVRDLIEEVIENTDWDWAEFETLMPSEAERLEEMLEEKLTQPQGWSLESLTEDIQSEFGLSQDVARGVAADTSHNVLNESKMAAFEDMEGSDEFEYDWIGPDDFRTTPVCEETKAEIEDRGGSVPREELTDILEEKAKKYEGTSAGGGTPDRVEHWEPHYQCRHTPVRRVSP